MMDSREELASHFTQYSKYGNKFPKAIEAVLSGNVKKHTFSPSGRVVLTVVGRDGEEFIDPERPFCSCSNFFFKVLGGGAELCSHLLRYKSASESRRLATVRLSARGYASPLCAIATNCHT